jgi:hypothetical protein
MFWIIARQPEKDIFPQKWNGKKLLIIFQVSNKHAHVEKLIVSSIYPFAASLVKMKTKK